MERTALKAAIELKLMPSRVRSMRDGPLPEGVPFLLRIAAGDDTAERQAVEVSERDAKLIREAASFFIEQMLLHPDADSYRILGAAPSASSTELRQNMALLMRWLHPDQHPLEAQTVFVNRVNRAWDTLKTAERRHAYDLTIRNRPASPSSTRAGTGGSRPAGMPSGRSVGGARMNGGTASGAGGSSGRRSQPPGYQRRALVLSDLIGQGDKAHSGLIRRLLGYLFRPRR